jgi:glycosyltransferase involved in cell wall biosynthesis
MTPGKTSISLCMIVKNEEEALPHCLASAAPYVDEIVVVDTGSTDRTVEIAESFGAQVRHFQWVDDFAAARNESLRHATGEWVLQLDADERLNLLGRPTGLREAAAAPGLDAYVVMIRCHHGAESSRACYGVNHNYRFFRRIPGIQYEKPVHESVDHFLRRGRAATANAAFVIDHYGYDIDPSDLNRKLERNLAILERAVEKDPHDPFVLYYLANTYEALGRSGDSLDALKRGLDLENAPDILQAMLLNTMSRSYLFAEDYDKVIETSTRSLAIESNQNTARYYLGIAYYNHKLYNMAVPYLISCYQYCRLPVEIKTTGLPQEYVLNELELLKLLAVCLFRMNNFSRAVFFSRCFLQKYDEDPDVHHIIGLSYYNEHQYSAALFHLDKAYALGVKGNEIQSVLACCALKAGEIEKCLEWLAEMDAETSDSIPNLFILLQLIGEQPNIDSQLVRVLIQKKTLLRKGTFEQLGSLLSTLARNGSLNAVSVVLESICQRTAEVESFMGGLIEYFLEENRLNAFYPILEGLVARRPCATPFLDALGIFCIKMGNPFRAIEVYGRLHHLNPDSVAYSRTLAGLYVSVGHEARALEVIGDHRPGGDLPAAGGHQRPRCGDACVVAEDKGFESS